MASNKTIMTAALLLLLTTTAAAAGVAVAVAAATATATATATASLPIYLPGACGSGPYEMATDWIAAFEASRPDVDLVVTSVGTGAAMGALWGEVDCVKKPVTGLCDGGGDSDSATTSSGDGDGGGGDSGNDGMFNNRTPTRTSTLWGIGGTPLTAAEYAEHGSSRGLTQLPSVGGPILVTYAKDVTGDLGSKSSKPLNMSFPVLAGIFNGTIRHWDHPLIRADNPGFADSLPSERITVLVRSDKSGMSAKFTEALRHGSPEGWPQSAVGKKPKWPLENLTHSEATGTQQSCGASSSSPDLGGGGNTTETGGDDSTLPPANFQADGQTGIGIGLLRRPFSVGYLEMGHYSTLTQFVSQAHVSSPSHPTTIVPASVETTRITMDGLLDRLDPVTLSVNMVDEDTPEGGYPMTRYIYWYLKTNPAEYDSCYQAWMLFKFVEWTYLDPIAERITLSHGWFVPPASVVERALERLREMQCFADDGSGSIVQVSEYDPFPPQYDLNHLGAVRALGLTMAIVIMLVSVLCAVWVVLKRNDKVVKASQPPFLGLVCVGAFIMGSSIVPLSVDDGVASARGCDVACMLAPWLFTLGFTTTFAALYSKIKRLNVLLKGAMVCRRVKVTARDVIKPFVTLLALNVAFLLTWTVADPSRWTRVNSGKTDTGELSSYGTCQSEGIVSVVCMALIATVNFAALLLANVQAYKARNVSDVYSESRQIGFSMLMILQACLIGTPVLFLASSSNTTASFIVRSMLICIISGSTLGLLFVPKFLRAYRGGPMDGDPRRGSQFSRTSGYYYGGGDTTTRRVSGLSATGNSGGGGTGTGTTARRGSAFGSVFGGGSGGAGAAGVAPPVGQIHVNGEGEGPGANEERQPQQAETAAGYRRGSYFWRV